MGLGLNPGGSCYGYHNIRNENGDALLEIVPEEAELVRRIFELRASGEGYRSIAYRLNEEKVPPPSQGRRGTASWSHTQVRSMLHNERYVGRLIYGRSRKGYKGGTKIRMTTEVSEQITYNNEALRIVPEALWRAVRKLDQKREAQKGEKGGSSKTRHLLSTFARCGVCGGSISTTTGRWGTNPTAKLYHCSKNHSRGATVCGNNLRRPVNEINSLVIDWIQTEILSEEYVLAAISEVKRRLKERAKTAGPDSRKLESERRKLANQIDALTETLSDAPRAARAAIVSKLDEKQRHLSELEAKLASSRVAPDAIDKELRRLEREAKVHLKELRAALEGDVETARRILEQVIDGGLTFTPENERGDRRFRIEGNLSASALASWKRPQGDLNPCCWREKPESWAN